MEPILRVLGKSFEIAPSVINYVPVHKTHSALVIKILMASKTYYPTRMVEMLRSPVPGLLD